MYKKRRIKKVIENKIEEMTIAGIINKKIEIENMIDWVYLSGIINQKNRNKYLEMLMDKYTKITDEYFEKVSKDYDKYLERLVKTYGDF